MKRINGLERSYWPQVRTSQRKANKTLKEAVGTVFENVESRGDTALVSYNKKWDAYTGPLELGRKQLESIAKNIDSELQQAIDRAYQNIYKYHWSQQVKAQVTEVEQGIKAWREARPIPAVGLYVPGGTAPLFSTLLMLGVPSQIAGNPQRVLCTPAQKEGGLPEAIAYAALKCGFERIFLLGGAQAVAAMTYGTETVPQVDKLFGPGNAYVMEGKVQAQALGVAIDMPAGPSEVLIIADQEADPKIIAADLIAQAEHGSDSQVILCTTSAALLDGVEEELSLQLESLERTTIAQESIKGSFLLQFDSLDDCFDFSNAYAPEHLILNLRSADTYINQVQCAGSVFTGPWAAESFGDYASGPNHTLPTGGFAKAFSGLGLDSFQNQISFQSLSPEAVQNLGPIVIEMANAESLQGHARAVEYRMQKLMPDE